MSKFSKKCPKTAFFLLVFSKNCLLRNKIGQNRAFLFFWESSENQSDRQKKIVKNFQNFLKIRPPQENPRSAPESNPTLVSVGGVPAAVKWMISPSTTVEPTSTELKRPLLSRITPFGTTKTPEKYEKVRMYIHSINKEIARNFFFL